MILIPEIKTVVILVPRTGSGSLYRAITSTYPKSMMLYRHMEADGVPYGYNKWKTVGVVRNPIERLWSLYKFIPKLGDHHPKSWLEDQRANMHLSFWDWVLTNRTVFARDTDDMDSRAKCSTLHPIPENFKSQHIYLRPDLGTEVYRFDDLARLAERLGITLEHQNQTDNLPPPALTAEAEAHMRRYFSWDLRASINPDSIMWWGYLHTNGQVQVKRYFDRADIAEAWASPFVVRTTDPFPALDREMAFNTATDRLMRAQIRASWSGEPA